MSIPTLVGDHETSLHIRWECVKNVVEFIQILPLMVSEEKKNAIILFLNRINTDIPVKGFYLNENAGVVAYTTHAFLDPKGSIEPEVLAGICKLAVQTATQILPQLQQATDLNNSRSSSQVLFELFDSR